MTKTSHRIGLSCVLTLLCFPVLCAKELATYRVGDVAEADIVTPVALDVIDPAATAALKSAEAMRTPAVFRICSDMTNALANEFLAGFAAARSNFTANIQDAFQHATVDDATIASPDFGYLVTAFNIKNKKFPVTTDLAATWARGNPGSTEQKRLLDFLLLTMQHNVRPDELPDSFVAGQTVRLVPTDNPNEKLTLTDMETRGILITESSLITISQLRIIFRREFTADDEQPLARELTALLKPNCLPDADLTQLARDRALRQLVVSDHYDAGQLIVRQGSVIDAKIKNTLDQLNEKSADPANQPAIVKRDDALREPTPALPAANLAQYDAPEKLDQITLRNQPLKIPVRNTLPAAGLAAVSAGSIVALWRLVSRRRVPLISARAINLPSQNPVVLHADLAPQLARVVRETLVQELAVQRRELLVAQQIATSEIIGLVQRLDGLQMTMQERVQAYEMQIQKLEKELAARAQENHELLKLKIEMIRQQLEVERTRNRMDFN